MRRAEVLSQPQSFRVPTPPESQFFNAKKEWQDRMGSLVIAARNWRFAALFMGIITLTVTVALVVETSQRKVIPVIVGIDPERGEAVAIGRAEDNLHTPTDTEIRYFLSRFIQDVRSVPLDLIVLHKNISNAYHYLGKSAAEALSEMMQNDPNNPVTNPGKRAISVQPISIVRIANSSSFQARWKESIYSPSGDHIEDYTMLATFTVDLLPPKTEEDIMVNPLGIFIQSFSWNRELSGDHK